MPSELPMVSVLMGAYNYERYVGQALESALAQDYPAERMEIVVVDDGSTDSTARVVAELARQNPGRIRLISQPNGGYIDSTNRAIAESRGELLALLDADDAWLPDKTRRQVEMLQANPEVGLVFSDMTVVDANDQVVCPSHLANLSPVRERCVPALLFSNFATTSSIMVRASLRHMFEPVPAAIPYADWWIALRAAMAAKVDWLPECLALYRVHGKNMTNGATGETAVRNSQMAVAFQLYALRHLSLDGLAPDELLHVWSGVEKYAGAAMQMAGTHFVDVAERQPPSAEEADVLLAGAQQAALDGDPLEQARLTLKALAWDPYRRSSRQALRGSVARARTITTSLDPFEAAQPFRVLADAEELLADDELMLAYAEIVAGAGVTLVIDGSELPLQSAEESLTRLVERCELSDRDDVDLLAVLGPQTPEYRERMLGFVQARYSRDETCATGLPVLTPASLGQALSRFSSPALVSSHDPSGR